MSRAALSTLVFGIYLWILGLTLIIAPNPFLGVFGIEPTQELWIRMVGGLACVLGYYYLVLTRAESRAFFRASIPGRFGFLLFCIGLVVTGWAPKVLVVFGAIDAVGACWTGLCLREKS